MWETSRLPPDSLRTQQTLTSQTASRWRPAATRSSPVSNLLIAPSVYGLIGMNEPEVDERPPRPEPKGQRGVAAVIERRHGKLLLELLWSGYNSCERKLSCCVYVCVSACSRGCTQIYL